jgi:multiple sugar transport system substrate-binding protein
MGRNSAWLGLLLFAVGFMTAIGGAAQTDHLIFLSTQLRPIEEAQKMRNLILNGFPTRADYITEQPQQFPVRVKGELQRGTHTIDVVGALHGELRSLLPLDAFVSLDDLIGKLTDRRIPDRLLTLGKFGTAHQLYVPWLQGSYTMVANKAALPYLPDGADIDTLTYDQLAAWAGSIAQKTGKPLLGFPRGHKAHARFFEGFLYPSYTGGVVVPFRSEAAETMWSQFGRYGKASIQIRRVIISCSGRCLGTCGSASITLPGCSMPFGKSQMSLSPSPLLPGPRGGVICPRLSDSRWLKVRPM